MCHQQYREAVIITVGHNGRLLRTVEVVKVAAVPSEENFQKNWSPKELKQLTKLFLQ